MGAVTARFRAVKGTRDLWPHDSERFAAVERVAREVFSSYGYGEIRTPILESTELFAHSVGQMTDIVHKEMYTFLDRKGRSLTLRPENTAGVARALIERGPQNLTKPLRLWYAGEQFRYERPQAGRYREFRQIGAELFGVASPAADAELLRMLFEFLSRLGFAALTVALNAMPTGDAREAFAEKLREHVRPHAEKLGPDDRRRVEENPLRLFDSRDPETRKVLEKAPTTLECLDDESRAHHEGLKKLLEDTGIDYVERPSLVRGLDYYTKTVFEVTSHALGAQDALLGGGRYDSLIFGLGGLPLAAVGFAIGEDRLIEAMSADGRDQRKARRVFFVLPGSTEEFGYALSVARMVRAALPDAVVETDLTGQGFLKGVMRASYAEQDPDYPFDVAGKWVQIVFLGPEERKRETVEIKSSATREQTTVPLQKLGQWLQDLKQ